MKTTISFGEWTSIERCWVENMAIILVYWWLLLSWYTIILHKTKWDETFDSEKLHKRKMAVHNVCSNSLQYERSTTIQVKDITVFLKRKYHLFYLVWHVWCVCVVFIINFMHFSSDNSQKFVQQPKKFARNWSKKIKEV